MRSQSGTSSSWGGSRYLPYAFTEQGVAMLSSVLHSPRAVLVNIEIMRAFVRLRQMLESNAVLAAAPPRSRRYLSANPESTASRRSAFAASHPVMYIHNVMRVSLG